MCVLSLKSQIASSITRVVCMLLCRAAHVGGSLNYDLFTVGNCDESPRTFTQQKLQKFQLTSVQCT